MYQGSRSMDAVAPLALLLPHRGSPCSVMDRTKSTSGSSCFQEERGKPGIKPRLSSVYNLSRLSIAKLSGQLVAHLVHVGSLLGNGDFRVARVGASPTAPEGETVVPRVLGAWMIVASSRRHRPAAFTRFRIFSHNGLEQVLPWQQVVHLGKEALFAGGPFLVGAGQVGETDLLHRDYLLCLVSNSNRVIAKGKTCQDT